jgi:hypothetical protein
MGNGTVYLFVILLYINLNRITQGKNYEEQLENRLCDRMVLAAIYPKKQKKKKLWNSTGNKLKKNHIYH